MIGKWIVIEGLDGTGKTSVVQGLTTKIANSVVSPPPDSDARKVFDSQYSAPIRRGFYFLCNAITKEFALKQIIQGKSVITDRWLASTVSYMSMDKTIHKVSDALTNFNKDYPSAKMPDLTILLTASQQTRIARLRQRDGTSHTSEEISLMDPEVETKCQELFMESGLVDMVIDTTTKSTVQVIDEILLELHKLG